MEEKNPLNVMCVCKNSEGHEIGRIPAAAKNAEAYITGLSETHGMVKVEYVEDATACRMHRLIGGRA